MEIKDLLKTDSIILNIHNTNKEEALDRLIDKHYECGHIKDKDAYKTAIYKREDLSTTGVGNMIAIPHAQDDSVNYPSLVAMVDKEGIPYDSLDNKPVHIIFMIAVPKTDELKHLEILAQLCQILLEEKIVQSLLKAQTPKHFIDILLNNINMKDQTNDKQTLDIVAVTACPTGIAHTYMAAKALEDAAKVLDVKIKVETNGASGVKNQLTQQDIIEAKAVIVAADKKVDIERFKDKHLIEVPVAKGIHEPQELIQRALHPDIEIIDNNKSIENNKKTFQFIKVFYKHMMNGISNIIPLLMLYGVFSQVIPMLHLENQIYNQVGELNPFYMLNYLVAFLPVVLRILFAGYIADSISDKPGFIVAVATASINIQSHILIIILIGFVAGYLVLGLKKIFSYIPKVLESIIPNILIPFSGILVMMFLLNLIPINDMSIYNAVVPQGETQIINPVLLAIIGFILGAMMSVDMGGPINKTAYCIGIIGIFMQRYDLMSAVMIGGMIPPIVIWLSSLISPSLFTEEERKGKWNCLIKGLCFVSEEAIPYMKKDKKGIHIPCIIASGIAGLLTMYYGCNQMFPHGGIITLPFISGAPLFLIALVASVLIGMSLVLILKKAS